MGDTEAGGKSWSKIRYKQDLAPPGGYGRIPYLKNLLIRGPSGYALFGMAFGIAVAGYRTLQRNKVVDTWETRDVREREMAYFSLLEAERDRHLLRDYKEYMESEALNFVGTGVDPDHKPGQDVYKVKRWHHPYRTDNSGTHIMSHGVRLWFEEFFRTDPPGP